MPLPELLTDTHPFGPIDQTLIDSLTDAVDLTGLYGPLSSALAGNYILISGRKGCGKSAVISMLRGFERVKGRLQRERIKVEDIHQRTTFITIKTWTEFFSMNTNVRRYLMDRTSAKSVAENDYDLIPPEVIEAAWISEIWDRIFKKIYDALQEEGELIGQRHASELKSVLLCFDDEAMADLQGSPDYLANKIFEAAMLETENFLKKHDTSICLLFDSMEKYPLANPTFSLSMGGFLRAINKITSQHHRIKIVFALPEEILPSFRSSSSNILKDFTRSFSMKWKPADLWRIAAYRYRLFLNIHDPGFYHDQDLQNSDWNDRDRLNAFFDILFPKSITNEIGAEEPPKAYVLRHTFLVPRHLLVILNRASLDSFNQINHWRNLTEIGIIKGIRESEQDIANEVFVPYEGSYRGLKSALNKVMGGLPPIFSYGDLDKAVSRISKQFALDDHEMIGLLFDMGIIGRLREVDTDSQKKGTIYSMADFFYNIPGNMSFSGEDTLCFHPIFSTYYNANLRRNGDKRIIYPHDVIADL